MSDITMLTPAAREFEFIHIYLTHLSDGRPWEWVASGVHFNQSYVLLDAVDTYGIDLKGHLCQMVCRLKKNGYLRQEWTAPIDL